MARKGTPASWQASMIDMPALCLLQISGEALACEQKSLRTLVQHWFAPGATHQVKVVDFRNNRARQQRDVCVEVSKTRDRAEMFLFRHDDGMGRVFPPARVRPAMVAHSAFSHWDRSTTGCKDPYSS